MTVGTSIVFINQNSGYLMIDIIRAHQMKYRNVALITGKLVSRETTVDPSVQIEKIIPYDKSTTWKRLFTWIWGFIQIFYLVKTKYRKAELYIVSNPPFSTFLPLFCSNKYHLLIFDVYPDALVEYKILKEDSPFIRIWRRVNTRVFQKATNIFTLSSGMKSLLASYAGERNIKVAPVWTNNSFLKPVQKEKNQFIARHGLMDKFLVMYSGNLGYTHELKVLVNCATHITDARIMFVIIGEGEKKRSLQEMAAAHNLRNFVFLSWQDPAVLPLSLAAADVGVVTLGKEASKLSVPSKTYNLMSVGAPLLCITSQESELASLVNRYGLGKCFDVSDAEGMAAYIVELASNQSCYKALQSRVLAASREFGPENALKLVV